MAGILLVDDDFIGLANNAPINGRDPPITDNSFPYAADPTVVSDGAGNVKFTGAGAALKTRPSTIDCAIQATVNMNGANEVFSLFSRDTQSTPYPRNGFMATFAPSANGGVNGTVTASISSNYVTTAITGLQDKPWTYAASGINVVAFESIGTNHRIIVNNVVAGSFTHASYVSATSNNRFGMVYHGAATASVMRLDRFSILDSVVISQPASFVVVLVS
jgi:hypothetical protein